VVQAAPLGSVAGRPAEAYDRAEAPPILRFDRVSKWYGPVIGLNDVTFSLQAGITGLVGPNGAGKSTLMKLATGQLRPSQGRVTVLGYSAWSAEAKWHLGYCPESDVFYEEMSGRGFVQAMARLAGYDRAEARRRTEEALELVGMREQAHRCVRGYSKGMRQRIKLAQALVHDPELLILDEPMNGIDPVVRRDLTRLFQNLAERGKSLLISSHQLEELERLTDRVMVVARGRLLAQGTVTEIRDMFENQPLSVRIGCDRPRALAGALLRLPEVLGVELGGSQMVLVRARQPQRFFRALAQLVVEEGLDLHHLEATDYSAQAILDYVLQESL